MLATSDSYELSASERPFDAKRHAAIHFAYWSSYKIISLIEKIKALIIEQFLLVWKLTSDKTSCVSSVL